MAHVLLVDDEPDFAATAAEILRTHRHEVTAAGTLARAREILDRAVPDVLLLDLMLPDGNGLELLEGPRASELKKVVVMTGHPGIKAYIKDLSGPSVFYLTKPIDAGELVKLVRALDDDADAASSAADADDSALHFGRMVGEHESMQEIYAQIEKVARLETPVLVSGETGTGKELVAEAIHRTSGRPGEFVAVNCGSLSRELAASELFGHEKGSYTGAVRRRSGFFRRADSGTLFLDEFTEMPLDLQPHFLRVLETHRVMPVGSEQETAVDVRIVAATNREPTKAVADQALRQDLYFRLSVFPLVLPPLRERRSDIPLLVKHFLAPLQRGKRERGFDATALRRLEAYQWPGNVRELRHVVQRAFIMSDPDAAVLELPGRFDTPSGEHETQHGVEAGRSIRDVERELIERTLAHFDGDKRAAAKTLGVSLNTLYNRLNSYQG
jgi:DNA-binding NtrC family response regulator